MTTERACSHPSHRQRPRIFHSAQRKARLDRGDAGLIRLSGCGTPVNAQMARLPLVRREPSPDLPHEVAIAFTPPAIVLISLRESPVLIASSCGTQWPSCTRPESAESGIPHYCAGTGDRLKRSQQFERLIQRAKVAVGKH